MDGEIEQLVDTLTDANATLLAYVNRKIEELDGHRPALAKEIADLVAQEVSPERMDRISGYRRSNLQDGVYAQ